MFFSHVFHELIFIRATLCENRIFANAKTKTQISFAVTTKLISAFVFAIRIVQSLYYLYTKFQASSHLVYLHSLVCVGPGRKPRRRVFSRRGSSQNVADQQMCSLVCVRPGGKPWRPVFSQPVAHEFKI